MPELFVGARGDRLRILVVSAYPPSRRSGPRVRMHGLVTALSRTHAVSIVCYVPPSDRDHLAELDVFRDRGIDIETVQNDRMGLGVGPKRALQVRSLMSTRSFARIVHERSAFQAAIDARVARARYDIVHVESSMMANFAFPRGATVVLDEHNIESDVLRRTVAVARTPARKLYNYFDYRKVRSEEVRAWRRVDACALTSPRDEAMLLRAVRGVRTAVVPNAVDLEFIAPRTDRPERGTLLFFGSLSYYPNRDALHLLVREVLPRIKVRYPSARLLVVGSAPPEELRRWTSPDVIVTGPVPDIRPYLARAHAVVVPLRIGGGTRFKILEAMAAGVPVVSTPLGAEGLAVTDGRDILLGGDVDELAAQVSRLLADDGLSDTLSSAARQLVECRYDWASSARRLEALYREAMLAGAALRAA